MAGLLGLNVGLLLRLQAADEWLAFFYTLLRWVPKNLLFVWDVPKLPMPPFRLPPASFLNADFGRDLEDHDGYGNHRGAAGAAAVCDQQELHVASQWAFVFKEEEAAGSWLSGRFRLAETRPGRRGQGLGIPHGICFPLAIRYRVRVSVVVVVKKKPDRTSSPHGLHCYSTRYSPSPPS